MTDLSSDEAILIEYLDGELPQRERQIVEERLAKEPVLRQELARLEKSWQQLDLLEREQTDNTVVETTIETVVLKTEESLNALQAQNKYRRYADLAVSVICVLLVFAGTFAVGSRFAPNDILLPRAAAPVIERLDMYLAVIDEQNDFLPMLAQQRVFLPQLPDGTPPASLPEYLPSPSVKALQSLSLFPSYSEFNRRIQRIESFDESFYGKFYNNYQKFSEFSGERRKKLRMLHENIESSPRRSELFQTLFNYYGWLKSLQNYEKAELRQPLPAEKQVAKIATLKKQLDEHLPGELTVPVITESLKTDDLAELSKTLDLLPMSSKNQILDAAPNQTLSILKRLESEKQ
ncbi:MAG: hypothetical protein LBN39_00315 [Planctomycetaceae bacterium]|jgi:hypothetical protein|nr:hypothetical protein [Planctomycetaceae bacterium]